MASNSSSKPIPPMVDIKDGDSLRAWHEGYRAGLMAGVNNTDNTAIVMHADIIRVLGIYGLDAPTGVLAKFGRGSTAKAVADKVLNLHKKASEHMQAAAVHFVAAQRVIETEFLVPIDEVKKYRASGQRGMLNI